MSLSQTQIIQSLGEALSWLEKELSWGVSQGELNHLTGRIGELYAAMITRGQMALRTNQRGYDVVSGDNERISVKTVTTSTHVSFRKSTFNEVDRAIVLRLNLDGDEGVSIEEIFDGSCDELVDRATETQDAFRLSTRISDRKTRPVDQLKEKQRASFEQFEILQYENGKIVVFVDGHRSDPAKPHLRDIASKIGVELFSETGLQKTTHQLGAGILRQLLAQGRSSSSS